MGEWVTYTEMIPCGLPIPVNPSNPAHSNAGNAQTGGTLFVESEPQDSTAFIEAHTGDPAELRTDDTGSMYADVSSFQQAIEGWSLWPPDTECTWGLQLQGMMDHGFTPPPDADPGMSWGGIAVVRAAAGDRISVAMRRRASDASIAWTGATASVTATGDWQRLGMFYTESGQPYEDRRDALLAGWYSLEAAATREVSGASNESVNFEVAFFGVEVSYSVYEEPTPEILVLPPLRQYPRDDALGTGTATRMFSSSQQSSLRQVGYY